MEVADPSKVLVSSRVLGITSQKMVQSLLYILIPMVDFSGGIKQEVSTRSQVRSVGIVTVAGCMTKIRLLAVTDFSLHYNPVELRASSTVLSVGVKLPVCEADRSGHLCLIQRQECVHILYLHSTVLNVCTHCTFTPQYLICAHPIPSLHST